MFQRLQVFQAQGKLAFVEAKFRRMLASAPDHLHARLGLGGCAWLAGDDGRAKAIFSELAAHPPRDDGALLDCAEMLRATGHTTEARRLLQGHWQRNTRLALILAELEEQTGNLEAAWRCCRQALESDPSSETATRKSASLLQRLGDRDGALAVIEAWAAIRDRHAAPARHMRAQVYRANGETAAAIAALWESLALDPTAVAWRVELASALRNAGQRAEAEAVLAAAPPSHEALLALGELALAGRNHLRAQAYAEAARQLAPERPAALSLQLRIALDARDFTAAGAAADAIERLGPEHAVTATRKRVEIFRAMAQEDQARLLLEDLQARQPRDVQLAAELARHHRRTGNRAAAEAQLQAALAWNPDHPALLSEACDFATQLEDYETALDFAQTLAAQQPDKVAHRLRIGTLLRSLGRDDAAEAVWREAQKRFAQTVEIKAEHGRRSRRAGDLDLAFQEARSAFAAWPGNMQFWNDLFDLTVKLGSVGDVEALLLQAPVQSMGDEVTLLRARARLARRRACFAEARDLLRRALDLAPINQAVLGELLSLSIRASALAEAQDYHARLDALQRPGRLFAQKSAGRFQNFQGQMLNDMMLDRAAMAELDGLRALPIPERIEALLGSMRTRPDHIPTATLVTATLREGGYFQPVEETGSGAEIPKRISQYWDTPSVPEDVLQLSGSWADLNPTWTYRRFNNDTALAYLRSHFPAPVSIAFQRAGDATTKADILRLAVLVRDGGLWADMDDRCLRPLEGFVKPGIRALFWQEPSGHIGNNVMAAEPDHPLLMRALVLAANAVNRGDRDKVWMLTGPGLLTRAFVLAMAEAGFAWRDWLKTVRVVDEFELGRQVAYHCPVSYKVQGRHWSKLSFREAVGKRPFLAPAERVGVAAHVSD